MSYRLRHGHTIGHEAKRVYEDQLRAAADALDRGGSDVHAIRKHIKKARVALLVLREAIGPAYDEADEELHAANRALGELADAHRIAETVNLLEGFDRAVLPDAAVARLRVALVMRAGSLEHKAVAGRTRLRARRAVLSALARAGLWHVAAADQRMLARSIRHAHARARDVRHDARLRPAVESYHEWRQRVKREWYLVRLVADRTGERLRDDQHRLAALDACLGRHHDVGVLALVVATEPILPRRDRAHALIVLRALMRDLRRKALVLAVALNDRPVQVERRVLALWDVPPRTATEAA